MSEKRHFQKQKKRLNTHVPDDLSLERLMGDVIHKMKNNLGGISGFATLLSRDLGENSPHLRLIEQIQSSVVRLDELAVDLMVLIRKVKPVIKPVQLKTLLNGLIAKYEAQNRIKCELHYSPAPGKNELILKSDTYILERIFQNLIRFTEHLDARIKQISVLQPTGKCTEIHVSIDDLNFDDDIKDDLIKIIDSSEPVEARLNFAICLKLIESLNAHIQTFFSSEKCLEFMIEIA